MRNGNDADQRDWISESEAARIVGLSTARMNQLRHSGDGPPQHAGKPPRNKGHADYHYLRREVEAWAAARGARRSRAGKDAERVAP